MGSLLPPLGWRLMHHTTQKPSTSSIKSAYTPDIKKAAGPNFVSVTDPSAPGFPLTSITPDQVKRRNQNWTY